MEEGQNRVAHKLDHLAARLIDRGHDTIEVGIEQLKDAFARKAIRQFGEASQIAQHQRCFECFDFATTNVTF